MGRTETRVFAAACACIACAFAAVPAAASADCTSQITSLENNVLAFNGTASASYVSGTLQSEVDPPLVVTMSVDHSASSLTLPDLTPTDTLEPGASGPEDAFANEQGPTGGSVSVNDTFSETEGGSSSQTGSGPTQPSNSDEFSSAWAPGADDLVINPSNCTYQFDLSYGVATTTQAGGSPDDPFVEDFVDSPSEPIPANLVFEGSSTTLPVSDETPSTAGGYVPYAAYQTEWGQTFDQNFPTTTTTASFTWKLTPTYRQTNNNPPTTTHCVVPNITGKTEAKAEDAIKKAECKVGTVTKEHSKKVAKGKVISQSPRAGKEEPTGTKVKLVVSLGKAK